MKKKVLFRIVFVLILVVLLFEIGFNANKKDFNFSPKLSVVQLDTIKPDVISEKRVTGIRIINGNKKITERITKMKGDSIIEEKVIEKEEDAIEDGYNFDMNSPNGFSENPFVHGYIDSMLSGTFKGFNFDPFQNDSLFFNFKFGPSMDFDFEEIFGNTDPFESFGIEGDIFENGDSVFNQRMKHIFKDFNLKPFNSRGKEENNIEFKSMKEIIRDQILDDGYISSFNDDFNFEMNENSLKINGKKQDKNIFKKYKKLIEENTGLELKGEFNYNFNSNNGLKKKLRKI